MTTTPPNNPFNFQDLLAGKIAEAAGQQLLTNVLGEGAKKLGEAGINHAKNMNVGDVLSTLGTIFEAATPTAAPKAEAKPAPAPAPAPDPAPAPAPAPAPTAAEVAEKIAQAGKEAEVAEAVSKGVTEEANKSIDAIHAIATKNLTTSEQESLVAAVMNLVRLSSPEGFKGEHVQWLSRLYGNKSI